MIISNRLERPGFCSPWLYPSRPWPWPRQRAHPNCGVPELPRGLERRRGVERVSSGLVEEPQSRPSGCRRRIFEKIRRASSFQTSELEHIP